MGAYEYCGDPNKVQSSAFTFESCVAEGNLLAAQYAQVKAKKGEPLKDDEFYSVECVKQKPIPIY